MRCRLICLLVLFCCCTTASAQQRSAKQYVRQLQQQAQAHPLQPAELHTVTQLFIDGLYELIVDRPEAALTQLQQALALDPLNAAIHFQLAQLLHPKPHLGEQASTMAIKHAYAAMALDPDNKFCYLGTVMMHVSLGQYKQAAKVYEQLFQHFPPTEEAFWHLASLYTAQRAYRRAIQMYEQLEQRQGVTPELTTQKQNIYFAPNKLKKAVAEGAKLIQAYPYEEAYVLALTQLLAHNNQAHKAIPYLKKDLLTNTDHKQVRFYLGFLLLHQGAYSQAEEHIIRGLGDTSLPLESKLALLYTYLKQLPAKPVAKQNQALAQALIQAHPQEADVCGICGDLYEASDELTQAQVCYIRALSLDNTNYDWWFNLIYTYIVQQATDQVLAWTDKAIQRFPDRVALYFYRGEAYLIKGLFNFRGGFVSVFSEIIDTNLFPCC